ncbi:MAG: shikimate kinase [Micavibrio aeruginosavorus]|uniref:Shikimate kinase n=1 Tax=Micavibrio aeruginosavorus TaxID=349221 RepID=A0A7T5R166_9BACT|nr:MAG: shikimate kinase [Micavibrio aeruginosavorus]
MAIDPQKIFSIRARLNRPIVLVGMMGAGKTRLGKMLSEVLGYSFADSDEEIERAAGLTISEIFERYGETYFRDGERRVVKRLVEGGIQVIATGGGAILNQDTAQEIWNQTLSIWVKADIPTILERTSRNDKRPLLKQGDPEEVLKRLSEARYPIYQNAHLTIESRNAPGEEMLGEAIDKIFGFLSDVSTKAKAEPDVD